VEKYAVITRGVAPTEITSLTIAATASTATSAYRLGPPSRSTWWAMSDLVPSPSMTMAMVMPPTLNT